MIKNSLTNLLDDVGSRQGSIFAIVIQCLIIASLVTFSIETIPDLSAFTKEILSYFESTIVIIFTVEYLLRLFVARRKLSFIFSFYGIIDFLAILPYYIFTGVDLRTVRIFRLLRLFRILKLVRYNKAISRFYRALMIAKEELILFSIVALVLLFLSAVGIYYFENTVQPEQFKSIPHSLWWAVVTLTTVGYGDIYPVTAGGRIFTFFVLMLGLGVVAVPTGLVSSALSQARSEENN